MFASRRIASTFIRQKCFSTTFHTINFLVDIHPQIAVVGVLFGTAVGGTTGLYWAYKKADDSYETTLCGKIAENLCLTICGTFFCGACGAIAGGACFALYPIAIPVCIATTYQHYANKPTKTDDVATICK